MTEFMQRIQIKVKGSILADDRYWRILNHYERQIAKGMKISYAFECALANLSGSNRHDTIRGQGND